MYIVPGVFFTIFIIKCNLRLKCVEEINLRTIDFFFCPKVYLSAQKSHLVITMVTFPQILFHFNEVKPNCIYIKPFVLSLGHKWPDQLTTLWIPFDINDRFQVQSPVTQTFNILFDNASTSVFISSWRFQNDLLTNDISLSPKCPPLKIFSWTLQISWLVSRCLVLGILVVGVTVCNYAIKLHKAYMMMYFKRLWDFSASLFIQCQQKCIPLEYT